jgi:hypothetical protein
VSEHPQLFNIQDLYSALRDRGCEPYLDLIHAGDLQGTKARIEEAQKVAPESGIATECGPGRTPVEHFEDLMAISAEVTRRVKLQRNRAPEAQSCIKSFTVV